MPPEECSSGLKASTINLAQPLKRSNVVRNGKEAPHSRLCVAVPGDIYRSSLAALQRDNSKVLIKGTSKVVSKGTVILNTWAEVSRIYIGVEYRSTVVRILSNCTFGSLAYENVTSGKGLSAALRFRFR